MSPPYEYPPRPDTAPFGDASRRAPGWWKSPRYIDIFPALSLYFSHVCLPKNTLAQTAGAGSGRYAAQCRQAESTPAPAPQPAGLVRDPTGSALTKNVRTSGAGPWESTKDASRPQTVKPWKYREESMMSNEQVAPETKGVTVKLLAMVDLGPEIEGMAGRQLRMRMVTFEPGGVFGPIHDHKDRPGIVYILHGTITDHRNGVATDYGPGVGWPEDRNTTHWLENRGTIPAVEISVDIVRQE